MPHSVFTGRVVTPGTSVWTATDTALAVALHQLESLRCPGCGHDRRESMDADTEFKWKAEPIRCHACATRERHSAAHVKLQRPTEGLSWIVTRTDQEGSDDG